MSGELDGALADARAGIERAEAAGTTLLVPMAETVIASVALIRGELGEADAHVAAARHELFGAATHSWIRGQMAEARIGPEGALGIMDDLDPDRPAGASAYRCLFLEEAGSAAWLVRLALAAGDERRAESAVGEAEHLAAENREYPSIVARAVHARGLLERDASLLEEAASLHVHPLCRASAWEDVGTVLDESGGDGARARFEKALSGYDSLGAKRDVSRVRRRLRSGTRAKAVRRPVSGWPSLTGSERNVADLVAEGLTNVQAAERLYLSRHTVDFHLRHVFQKLGIRSRVELARQALVREIRPLGA
jgi:DNA-binding CsgD family transcriptional regulator